MYVQATVKDGDSESDTRKCELLIGDFRVVSNTEL